MKKSLFKHVIEDYCFKYELPFFRVAPENL